MPKAPKPEPPKPQQLLVEGKNDRHVIWALCNEHNLPENFSVDVTDDKEEGEGIEKLLASISLRLKQEDLQTLGIVIDADQDLAANWQAVCDRLFSSGYKNIPKQPPATGLVHTTLGLPKIGIWVMPDNQINGMLEDFAARLISPDKQKDIELAAKVELFLQEMEKNGLNKYKLIHHPKAFIHTWLACQEKPGMPMGQAITATVLSSNAPLALSFVAWLKSLFSE
jgi:hypothetical protein